MFFHGSFIPPEVRKLEQILWHFGSHRVLTVATRTGILRRLATAPASADELARELDLDAPATGKLVRALCAMGLLERRRGEVFSLPPALKPLFEPGLFELTALVELSHELYNTWGENLEQWVRGETAPRHELSGERAVRFSQAMSNMTNHLAPMVLGTLQATRARRGLDLGGGLGSYAQAFCRINKGLRMTVVDLPAVVAQGQASLGDPELKERIEFIAGNYFELPLEGDYDLVILANVLHQELPQQAERLLQRASELLAPGGRLGVIDFIIDPERAAHATGCLAAINMFSFGDVYPEPTIRRWMARAGLCELRRTDLYPVHWLISGRRG